MLRKLIGYSLAILFSLMALVGFVDIITGEYEDSLSSNIVAVIVISIIAFFAYKFARKSKNSIDSDKKDLSISTKENPSEFVVEDGVLDSEFQSDEGIKISDKTTVKDLKDKFKDYYNLKIRIYHQNRFAKDDATLESIKLMNSRIPNSYFSVKPRMKVKTVEEKFNELFGVRIRVEDSKGNRADIESRVSQNYLAQDDPPIKTNAMQQKLLDA